MFQPSDNGGKNVYRVNVTGYDNRTRKSFHVRINVLASSPSKATMWVLTYPDEASLPSFTSAEILSVYKLRKQPVWLRKRGYRNYRFTMVQKTVWLVQ